MRERGGGRKPPRVNPSLPPRATLQQLSCFLSPPRASPDVCCTIHHHTTAPPHHYTNTRRHDCPTKLDTTTLLAPPLLGRPRRTLCHRLPFEAESTAVLYKKIRAGLPSIPGHVSASAAELLNAMLQVAPESRWSLDNVMKSEWVCVNDAGHPH